jgi:hypothetical protein
LTLQFGKTASVAYGRIDTSEYPERDQWLEDFQNIQTGIDVALFMTEAKLKLKHAVDLKKCLRESRKIEARER